MGFTIDDALLHTKERYKLELLAGYNGCGNAISWVHMVEDTTMLHFFWGKELIITTCLGFQSEDKLKELVEGAVKYNCAGLIINIGEYIHEVPKSIISYCEENDFPLLTVPWETSIGDMTRDYCIRCFRSERSDQEISRCFINALQEPENQKEYYDELAELFDVDGKFQVIMFHVADADILRTIDRRKISFEIQNYLERIDYGFSFFWYDEAFVLIVNNVPQEEMEDIVSKMLKKSKKSLGQKIYVGIGNIVETVENVHKSYKQALAATNMAVNFNEIYVTFETMGIYQLLYSIQDNEMLMNLYQKPLEKILAYDKKHNGQYEDTLYYYLKYNGSIISVSQAMYTHRNTINYRINKIKDLLENDLSTPEDRFPLQLAFYIKKMNLK